MIKDYYYILGVKQTASLEEIKRAHRKLSHKFHPDKNDGDEFFADRFKDIQEAYETLTNPAKRKVFDMSRNGSSPFSEDEHRQELNPDIEYFNSSRASFELGQEITFSWKTAHANKVVIKPFGQVPTSGQKTYRISNCLTASLNFELIAENTELNSLVRATLTLKNNSHREYEPKTKEKIESETRQKAEEEKYNKQVRRLVTVILTVIALFTLFRVIQILLK